MQIQLDRERNLRFNLNTLAWLEAELSERSGGKLGVEFLEWFVQRLQKASFELQTALLWACLRHEDKAITIDQAGELLSLDPMTCSAKCMEAMSAFFAGAYRRPLSSAAAANASDGSTSEPSAATISG